MRLLRKYRKSRISRKFHEFKGFSSTAWVVVSVFVVVVTPAVVVTTACFEVTVVSEVASGSTSDPVQPTDANSSIAASSRQIPCSCFFNMQYTSLRFVDYIKRGLLPPFRQQNSQP